MNNYKPKEGVLFVDIIEPKKKETDNGHFKSTGNSDNNPRIFKKAIIKATFSEEKYPVDSAWMMGESPGIKVDFFGEYIIIVQEKDLYAQVSHKKH